MESFSRDTIDNTIHESMMRRLEKREHTIVSKINRVSLRSQKLWWMMVGCICLLLITGCAQDRLPPKAANGVLDLTDWDFGTHGNVALAGQWEFFWNQLLTPDDFKKTDLEAQYITMPGLWKGTVVNGKPLPGQGYATYRLKVKMAPDTELKSLVTKGVLSVGRIWVNGRQVSSSGEIGIDKDSEQPLRQLTMPYFNSEDGEIEIVLQISNFHNVQGGLNSPIWFGNADQIQHMMFRTWGRTAILGGIFLVMGFYHLLLYALYRKTTENLYFGAYCLAWSMATMFTDAGGCLADTLIPALPWSASIDVTLICYGLMNPLIIMFYHSLFRYKRSPYVKIFYQVTGVLFILYLLVTPPNAYGPVVALHRLTTLGIIPYLLFQLVADIVRGEMGARLLIPGYLFLTLSFFNDKLYDLNVINSVILAPFGSTVFLLSYSFLISFRSSRAFARVEALSQDLKQKNIELEAAFQTLQENTRLKSQLEEQKRKEQLARVEAERSVLETLRYQLNPHFLFNALTSIRGAVVRDRAVAREMVANLSDFCRLTLSGGKEERMAVKQEVELVGLYLKIEQTRLGEYLRISSTIDPAVEEMLMPSFLLQPLVENAVKYGKLTSPEQLEVSITAEQKNGCLHLEVANTGEWVESGTDPELKSTGIGLDNLQKRLKKLYADGYTFSRTEENGWVRIAVELPAERKTPPPN